MDVLTLYNFPLCLSNSTEAMDFCQSKQSFYCTITQLMSLGDASAVLLAAVSSFFLNHMTVYKIARAAY